MGKKTKHSLLFLYLIYKTKKARKRKEKKMVVMKLEKINVHRQGKA